MKRITQTTAERDAMKTVFIGGSRHISRLNFQVKARLDRLIEQNLSLFTMDRAV